MVCRRRRLPVPWGSRWQRFTSPDRTSSECSRASWPRSSSHGSRAFRSGGPSPYSYHSAAFEKGWGGEMNSSACPSDEQLDEVIGGGPEAGGGWVVTHLEDCPECQRRLDRMVSQD